MRTEIGNPWGRIWLRLDDRDAIDMAFHYGLDDAGARELVAAVKLEYPFSRELARLTTEGGNMQHQPTVSLRIAGSVMAFDESGEILETNEFDETGTPVWENAGICDHRGGGGQRGFQLLSESLSAGEANARELGLSIDRVSRSVPEVH